jgi:hypothetical protein
LADFVAKRFCASERAILIQDQAPMRKVDSKVHSPRFDCCAFLFYSFSAETFATKSAHPGSAGAVRWRLLSGVGQTHPFHQWNDAIDPKRSTNRRMEAWYDALIA